MTISLRDTLPFASVTPYHYLRDTLLFGCMTPYHSATGHLTIRPRDT